MQRIFIKDLYVDESNTLFTTLVTLMPTIVFFYHEFKIHGLLREPVLELEATTKFKSKSRGRKKVSRISTRLNKIIRGAFYVWTYIRGNFFKCHVNVHSFFLFHTQLSFPPPPPPPN